MREADVEKLPKAARAVLVGTALNPGKTEATKEGIELRTLWGRMAYELGGKEAYALVTNNDANGSSQAQTTWSSCSNQSGPASS